MVKRRLSWPTHRGALTDEEVNDRIYRQIQIIEDEANKEINVMSVKSTDSNELLAREMAADPKEQIDEWVEKVRAYTERQTLIHSARLRRIAKLRVLEAFGNTRELIKEEARERIKQKMTGSGKDCDELLGLMLYQGVVRLMEPTVLVHSTRSDIKKVEKHYAWATKKCQDETGFEVKLITSKHPLKSSYYGRIVLSDKKSTMFVDVNLHSNVDKIADEVFTDIAAIHGKYKTPFVLETKNLRTLGYNIMPKATGITSARLEMIISTMHGDPRTQMPTFSLIEESRKQQEEQEQHKETLTPAPVKMNRRKVTIPYITPPPTGGAGGTAEPMMSVVPAKYMFRQQEENSVEEFNRASKDLYNLENAASSVELNVQAIESSTLANPGQSGHPWRNMAHNSKASPDQGIARSKSVRSGGLRASRDGPHAEQPDSSSDANSNNTFQAAETSSKDRSSTAEGSRKDKPPQAEGSSKKTEGSH